MSVHACGYNGFEQIFQLAAKNDDNYSPLENTQYYDKPVRLKTADNTPITKQQWVITWSKINCGRTAEYNGDVLARSWKYTLCRGESDQLHLIYDTNCVKVGTSLEIYRFVGGEDSFLCLHDKGCLSEMTVEVHSSSPSPSPPPSSTEETFTLTSGHTLSIRSVFTSAAVTTVSCGKEHVLFLTQTSQVFSFGLGSRGQLGHDCVEEERTPRVVEVLDGVGVVDVAAGGWHSAVVTASGDVFTWGWNESGQLGHRSGNRLLENCTKEQENESCSGKIGERLPSADLLSEPHESSTGDALGDHTVSENKKDSSDYTNMTSRSQMLTTDIDVENYNVSDNSGKVTLQSSPLLVTSLPHDYTAIHVSCGSRHTGVVTDDGKLYTTGWNRYGQLGHGHIRSRDSFQAVPMGTYVVKDVLCGWWNTLIFSDVT